MRKLTARIDGYEVRISKAVNLDTLAKEWQRLENLDYIPFFLTWHWVEAWIKSYSPEYLVVSAQHQGQLVAIGLFTRSTTLRKGLIYSRQLRLHQIGRKFLDQIWMEYNDFICHSEHQGKATNACLKALQSQLLNWDEIILSMMKLTRATEVSYAMGDAFITQRQACYVADLATTRNAGATYLDSLHRNTRYQIRYSIRTYQDKYGKLRLERAAKPSERLEYFHQAGELHRMRWQDSGFTNPAFVSFHEALIRNSEVNQVDLLRLKAGECTIAVMYYHIVGKRVYFYLHGLLFDRDPKLKPGLVAHSFASQHYMDNDFNTYDYMGGHSQYKVQLAERVEDLVTICIQKPKLRFWLENLGRIAKNSVLRRSRNSLP